MIALVSTKYRVFPSELRKLPHGELQFILSSLMYEAEIEKKKIELTTRRRTRSTPKKLNIKK